MAALTVAELKGKHFNNFINAIKSPATQENYKASLKRYLNYLKNQ